MFSMEDRAEGKGNNTYIKCKMGCQKSWCSIYNVKVSHCWVFYWIC